MAEMGNMMYGEISVEELLREIREDVEEFEFGKASEKVQTLLERMEGGGIDET